MLKKSLLATLLGLSLFSTNAMAEDYQVTEQPITVQKQLYGKLYQPKNVQGKVPLIIYSHGLGGTHTNLEKFAQVLQIKVWQAMYLISKTVVKQAKVAVKPPK